MMYTADTYLDLIPKQNLLQPDFRAVITALCGAAATATNIMQGLIPDFDLDIAVGVQLDRVGLWIGRDRYVILPITGVFFSWNTSGVGWQEGYWKGRFTPATGIVALDDTTYRKVLRAKIVSNNWRGSADEVLAAYQALVAPATVNIKDNQDMSVTMTITGAIPAIIKSLIENGEIPLKPAGVSMTYIFV